MDSRRTGCVNCHKQICCQACRAMVHVEAQETVPKAPLGLYLKQKLSFTRSQASTFSVPMPANTAGHQSKRAVLCGVSYKQKKHKLKGTVNDVMRMRSLLVEQFGFPNDAILVLTDDGKNPNLTPTKENMQNALRWLVADCKPGDSLVFYFSGHGLRRPEFNGDEVDGFDETICPSDFMTAGMIFDNDINTTIVTPLKEGVTLHAITDACHSGTILDLEHVYDQKQKRWIDNNPPSGASKGTSGGLAISLSACADDQLAADTNALSGNEMSGAMTYILIQVIKENQRITYGNLIKEMNKKIEIANRTGCLYAPFLRLRRIFHRKLIQETQLSSSQEFEVDKVEFKL